MHDSMRISCCLLSMTTDHSNTAPLLHTQRTHPYPVRTSAR